MTPLDRRPVEPPWEAGVAPASTLSLDGAFAYLNYGHRERQHIFRLLTRADGAFNFQAISSNDALLWCA